MILDIYDMLDLASKWKQAEKIVLVKGGGILMKSGTSDVVVILKDDKINFGGLTIVKDDYEPLAKLLRGITRTKSILEQINCEIKEGKLHIAGFVDRDKRVEIEVEIPVIPIEEEEKSVYEKFVRMNFAGEEKIRVSLDPTLIIKYLRHFKKYKTLNFRFSKDGMEIFASSLDKIIKMRAPETWKVRKNSLGKDEEYVCSVPFDEFISILTNIFKPLAIEVSVSLIIREEDESYLLMIKAPYALREGASIGAFFISG